MIKPRYLLIVLAALAMVSLSGCKAQQQMQNQVAELKTSVADAQNRLGAMDQEVKKANFEIAQLKQLVTKLGNVIVDLQKAEEERQKAAAARAVKAPKPAAKKAPAKKRR